MGFWSGLGKILKVAAPIAAMAIPGVGPIAAAAIAGGGSALGNKMAGGSWKGSLINGLISGGAAGLMPGAGAAGGAAGGAAKQGIGSTLKRIGGNVLTNLMTPDTLGEISRGTGAIANTQAHNRGVELDAMMAADQQRMLNDQHRRDDERHIMSGVRAANYIKSGGMQQRPRTSVSGRNIPSFRSPAPISDGEKQAATTLEQQLMNRLNNPAQLRDYDSKMKPGTMENVMNYASPIMGILGSIQRQRTNATQTPEPTIDISTPRSIFNPGPENPFSGAYSNIFQPQAPGTPAPPASLNDVPWTINPRVGG